MQRIKVIGRAGGKVIAALWLGTILFLSPDTFAGVVIQPVAVTTDLGTSIGSPENVINQRGLLVNYISGVTDFETYYFSNPGHNSIDDNAIWTSRSPFLPGNFDFALGGQVLVQSMLIWNCDNQRGIYGFNLLADDNPAFSSPIVLGSFLVDNDGPGERMAPHTLPFTPTVASYVRMEVISNNGPDPLNVQMERLRLSKCRNLLYWLSWALVLSSPFSEPGELSDDQPTGSPHLRQAAPSSIV